MIGRLGGAGGHAASGEGEGEGRWGQVLGALHARPLAAGDGTEGRCAALEVVRSTAVVAAQQLASRVTFETHCTHVRGQIKRVVRES